MSRAATLGTRALKSRPEGVPEQPPFENMKHFTQVPVPATTRKVCALITCDICKETTKTNWQNEHYDATETEIRLKTGNNYPEGGSGEETTIDICPRCFQEKLIPWVQSHGGEPTTREWDW